MSSKFYNALIRTHHITSRKKVAKLRRAWSADSDHLQFILLRSGGFPGMMYVEGETEASVQDWVNAVQRLRYKDYHLAARPAEATRTTADEKTLPTGFFETGSIKDFASHMQQRGVHERWRKAMGFVKDDDHL